MPKFDDRFARQNRCEPPPEFPLASPYSGIVHHLSGPSSCAPTQIPPMTSGSVDGAPREGVPTSVHFHSAPGLGGPNTRTDARLLGPCFKTGRLRPLRQHPCRSAALGPGGRRDVPGCNAPPKGGHVPGTFLAPSGPMLARPEPRAPAGLPVGWSALAGSGRKRFPFNNFTCCLTLFPKCFSSFDHSTCALSVSGRYLALDGIYHPV